MKRILYILVLVNLLIQVGVIQAQDDDAYRVAVQEMPEPLEGIMGIQRNVIYPKTALRDKIWGTVYVEVFINEGGSVVRTNVIKGIRDDLNMAAVEAVMKTKFKPGYQNGKPVKVRFAIPIRFMLGKPLVLPPTPTVDQPTIVVVQGPEKLKELISYPRLAIRAGMSGTVYATVTFDRDWHVQKAGIISGFFAGCDQQVLKALVAFDWPKELFYTKSPNPQTFEIAVQFVLPKKK